MTGLAGPCDVRAEVGAASWNRRYSSSEMLWLLLEVKTDNPDAIGLYESLGYSKLNVRKDYFGAGIDAQVMRLELS